MVLNGYKIFQIIARSAATIMSLKINWNSPLSDPVIRFDDIEANTPFVIDTPASRGAVYVKVVSASSMMFCDKNDIHGIEYQNGGMYEIATGKVFPPTTSPIKVVPLSYNVSTPKPEIYK